MVSRHSVHDMRMTGALGGLSTYFTKKMTQWGFRPAPLYVNTFAATHPHVHHRSNSCKVNLGLTGCGRMFTKWFIINTSYYLDKHIVIYMAYVVCIVVNT